MIRMYLTESGYKKISDSFLAFLGGYSIYLFEILGEPVVILKTRLMGNL